MNNNMEKAKMDHSRETKSTVLGRCVRKVKGVVRGTPCNARTVEEGIGRKAE